MPNSIEEKLKDLMSLVFNVPAECITDEASPSTIEQWDSFQHMNLIVTVEESFGVRFDETEIAELTRFSVIADTLRRMSNR